MSYGYGPTSAGSTQPGQFPGVGKLWLTYDWQYTRKGHVSNAGDTQEHGIFFQSTDSNGVSQKIHRNNNKL